METNKFLEMYRVQSITEDSKPLVNRNIPIKKVIISSAGKIDFNPSINQYVYFSRTDKHHIYYIFNKILKIIVDELKKYENLKVYKTLGLPDDLKDYYFYRNIDWNVIKRVQEFFRDYISPIGVELVTMKYLSEFSQFIEKCSVSNKKTKTIGVPEISDTRYYQGAYGINDAWLELLRSSIISTKTTNLYIDKFFEFYIGNSSYRSSAKARIRGLLKQNPKFFEMLDYFTYTELNNPEFLDKNNANNIVKAVNKIYKNRLYNQNAELTVSDFNAVKKEFKTQIEEFRMEK